jgi:hypothetical protein
VRIACYRHRSWNSRRNRRRVLAETSKLEHLAMLRAALVMTLFCALYSQGIAQQDRTPQSKAAATTDAQKKDFIDLLQRLPHKGEFYTDEAVDRAEGYLPVLLSLNEHDLDGRDLYPFAAMSRGLCDKKQDRDYVVAHFNNVQHPKLKLFWAVMIFDDKAASSEIKLHLRRALQSEQQSQELRAILGPKFEDFKKRVLSTAVSKR